ncbi:hypothetical protein K4G60_g5466, partial [Candida parapsilosis]
QGSSPGSPEGQGSSPGSPEGQGSSPEGQGGQGSSPGSPEGQGSGSGSPEGQGSSPGSQMSIVQESSQGSIVVSPTVLHSVEGLIPSLETVSIMQSSESSSSESNPAEISAFAAVGATIGYSIGAISLAFAVILL